MDGCMHKRFPVIQFIYLELNDILGYVIYLSYDILGYVIYLSYVIVQRKNLKCINEP